MNNCFKKYKEEVLKNLNHQMNKNRIGVRGQDEPICIDFLFYPLRKILLLCRAEEIKRIVQEISSELSESEQKFLGDMLVIILRSDGNYREVFQIIENNSNLIDGGFVDAFRTWTKECFNHITQDSNELTTIMINSITVINSYLTAIQLLSFFFLSFYKGDKKTNVDIAIVGFESCLNLTSYIVDYYENQFSESLSQFPPAIKNLIKEQFLYKTGGLFSPARYRFDLGTAYLIKGSEVETEKEKVDNLKSAIQHIGTLEECDLKKKENLGYWATVNLLLGRAYLELAKLENRNTENSINNAINKFKEAEEVCKDEKFSMYGGTPKKALLAKAQYCLGEAYLNIKDWQLSIRFWTLFPIDWLAAILLYLKHLKQKAKQERIKIGISYLEASKEIFSEISSGELAETQRLLGIAYSKNEKRDDSIKAFQSSLIIFTPEEYPRRRLEIGREFGDVASHFAKGENAIEGYLAAIDAVEKNRDWIASDFRKQRLQEEVLDVYEKTVRLYVKQKKEEEAIEIVERSKTQNLLGLLTESEIYPKRSFFPSDERYQQVCGRLRRYRREITTLKYQIDVEERKREASIGAIDSSKKRKCLHDLQNQLQQFLKEEIEPKDKSFCLSQQVQRIKFEEIQALLPNSRSAIVEWYLSEKTIFTFVITKQHIKMVDSSDVIRLKKEINNYQSALKEMEKDDSDDSRDEFKKSLEGLAEALKLDKLFKRSEFIECDQVILIPHRDLHLIPIHALPLENGSCLLDHFPQGVHYAPSCRLLKISQSRERPHFKKLVAIKNPNKDLRSADLEVKVISSKFFKDPKILPHEDATKDALMSSDLATAHCIHFACHGYFNQQFPLKSDLWLSKDSSDPDPSNSRLTLAEIFKLDLNQCRLVTLSACETGVIDSQNTSDEYIGLPSGFLYAGAQSVLASLWKVKDLSTALLMMKFYEILPKQGSVAVSLNESQRWLRDLSKDKLKTWIEEYSDDQIDGVTKRALLREDPQRFQNPYYWAGFCAIGD